jgi:hypothetical protein
MGEMRREDEREIVNHHQKCPVTFSPFTSLSCLHFYLSLSFIYSLFLFYQKNYYNILYGVCEIVLILTSPASAPPRPSRAFSFLGSETSPLHLPTNKRIPSPSGIYVLLSSSISFFHLSLDFETIT